MLLTFNDMSAFKVLTLFCAVARVGGHMIMASPTPFNAATIDNSPLSNSGSDFPCKLKGDPATFYKTDGISNNMAVGESQTLSFKGSAVHGGGSCQLAITSDMQPSSKSTWQVILSIEGGCPSTDGTGPSTYPWKIPEGVAPGKYVFAWTWISKIAGQPEYYMNCAPIVVTGGSSNNSSLAIRDNSLPNLFVANLASINSCKTEPGTDPVYPDPGPNVSKPGTSPKYANPSGSNCFPIGGTSSSASSGNSSDSSAPSGSAAGSASSATSLAGASASASSSAATSSGSGSSESGSGSGSGDSGMYTGIGAQGGSSSTAASSIASSSAVASSSAGAFANGGASGGASMSTSTVSNASPATATNLASSVVGVAPNSTSSAMASSAASVTSAASAPSGTASSSSGSSTSGGLTGACTSEGIWNCLGGSSFQRCASSQWSVVQAMPGGTTCTPGQSQNLWARGRINRVRHAL